MRKTTQAMKVSASWTPNEEVAHDMARAAFGDLGVGGGLRFDGGRILVKTAIATKMNDPDHAVRVAQRIKQIEAELRSNGRVHSFTTLHGAVLSELVEHLPEPPLGGATAAEIGAAEADAA